MIINNTYFLTISFVFCRAVLGCCLQEIRQGSTYGTPSGSTLPSLAPLMCTLLSSKMPDVDWTFVCKVIKFTFMFCPLYHQHHRLSACFVFICAVSTCWHSGCAARVTTEVLWPKRKRPWQFLPLWSVCPCETDWELSGFIAKAFHLMSFFSFSVWRRSFSNTLQQRVSMHHNQASSEGGTLSQTGRSWMCRANAGGTVSPGAHVVSDPTCLCESQREGKSVFLLICFLSVCLPKLRLCWSNWFWWWGSGGLHKGKC